MKRITRRKFIQSATMAAGLAASVPILEACAAAATPTPVVVEKVVTKEVPKEVTKIVEKEVTKEVPKEVTKIVEKTVVKEVPKEVTKIVEKTVVVEVTPTPLPTYKDRLPAKPRSPEVTIEIASWQPEGWPDWEVQTEMNKEFEQNFPGVKVKLTQFSQGDASQQMLIRFKEGNPPEVYGVAKASEAQAIRDYFETGMIHELTPYMKDLSYDTPGKTWIDTIDESVHQFLIWEGKWMAWPMEITYATLFTDNRTLNKLGLKIPTNWTEFVAAMDTAKKAGIDGIQVIDWMAPSFLTMTWKQLVPGKQIDDLMLNKAGSWKDPEYLEGAKMVRDLYDKGYWVEGLTGEDYFLIWAAIVQQKTLFFHDGTWCLENKAKFEAGDIQPFKFPAIEGGKGDPDFLGITSNIQNVPEKAKHPDLGAEWGRMRSSVKWQSLRAEKLGYTIPIKGIRQSGWPPAQRVIQLYQAHKRYGYWGTGTTVNLANVSPELTAKYGGAIGKFMAKASTPEQLIDDLDAIWKELHPNKR